MIAVATKYKNTNMCIDKHIYSHSGLRVGNAELIKLLTADSGALMCDLHFTGYYQLDGIYPERISEIKKYILDHPDILLYSIDDPTVVYTYETKYIYGPSMIHAEAYDFILHLRLEDVAHRDKYMCIKVEKFIDLLCAIDKAELSRRNAIVVHSTHTEFEEDYVRSIKRWFTENNISVILEDNDIYTDFSLLSRCKILVCSMSTLSWSAAMLSDVLEKCYFPDYQANPCGQTLKYPIKNTILYMI